MVVIVKKCRKCGKDFTTGGMGGQSTCDLCSDQVAYLGIRQPDGSTKTEIRRAERGTGWRDPRAEQNINDEGKVIDRLGVND